METKQEFVQIPAPAKMLADARFNRFSNIIYRWAVALFIAIGVLLLSSILFSILGPVLYFCVIALLLLMMGAMLVFTLGTVVVMPWNPLAKLWDFFTTLTSSSNTIIGLIAHLFNATKWVSLVGIVVAVLSIVLICVGKKQPKVGKIILLSIFIVLMVIVFGFQVLTGGVQWQ